MLLTSPDTTLKIKGFFALGINQQSTKIATLVNIFS